MSNLKSVLRPRNYETPILDQYAALLTPQDLAEVAGRAMKLQVESQAHGLNEASKNWSEALLSLLLQKGYLKSLDQIKSEK